MLWELIGLAIEGAIELAVELFEEGQDSAAAVVPTDAAAYGGTVYESTNYAAAMDGGISADRFDPAPVRGPYAP